MIEVKKTSLLLIAPFHDWKVGNRTAQRYLFISLLPPTFLPMYKKAYIYIYIYSLLPPTFLPMYIESLHLYIIHIMPHCYCYITFILHFFYFKIM